jgi:hypothetical protein
MVAFFRPEVPSMAEPSTQQDVSRLVAPVTGRLLLACIRQFLSCNNIFGP